MNVPDEKHDAFLRALIVVDDLVAQRKGETTGSGDVECPLCKSRIDYTFSNNGRRPVLRMRCRTTGCIVAMS